MDYGNTTFGRKVVKEGSAAAVVSPCKTREEVEREDKEGKELYRKVLLANSHYLTDCLTSFQSHNAWDVGEMMDRDYDWSVFSKTSLYGVPTPHDNSGSQVRDALHWMSLEQR